MRKCPNCAEENISESLFCKHCGRCLLAPEPEKLQLSIAMQTGHHETGAGIEFCDGPMEENSRVARLKRRHPTAPSVIGGRILLLNLLVLVLLSYIGITLVFELVMYSGLR
jgi:hypothetical protein